MEQSTRLVMYSKFHLLLSVHSNSPIMAYFGWHGVCLLIDVRGVHSLKFQYICSTVHILNVRCARATTFIFNARKDVLVKCRNIWDRKCLDLRGLNHQIHAECHLSYQGQTFPFRYSLILALWYRYFVVKIAFEMLPCMDNIIHFRLTNGFCVKVLKFTVHKIHQHEGDDNLMCRIICCTRGLCTLLAP